MSEAALLVNHTNARDDQKPRLDQPEKQWLASRIFYQDIDESRLTSIFYFTLIWNIFERAFCNRDAKINVYAPCLALDYAGRIEQKLNYAWIYFHQRYVANNGPTHLFYSFEFKPKDKKDVVLETLIKNETATPVEKLEVQLRIIFRLRNNLYHGEKEAARLYEQNENFRQANLLLMAIIDASQGN